MATSKTKSRYVPGTWTIIPSGLLAFREKFKVIGKNVFVVTGLEVSVASLKADRTSLKSHVEAKPGITLGEVVTLVTSKSQKRKATDAECKEYEKAREKYDKFVSKVLLAKKAERKQALVEAECNRALAILKKHKRLPEVAASSSTTST